MIIIFRLKTSLNVVLIVWRKKTAAYFFRNVNDNEHEILKRKSSVHQGAAGFTHNRTY